MKRKRGASTCPGKALQPMEVYPSDLSDDEWAILEPLLPPGKPGRRPREVDTRRVLNGIFYMLRSGCAWRMLPRDYPPRSTVYGYFARLGGLETSHDHVAGAVSRSSATRSHSQCRHHRHRCVQVVKRGKTLHFQCGGCSLAIQAASTMTGGILSGRKERCRMKLDRQPGTSYLRTVPADSFNHDGDRPLSAQWGSYFGTLDTSVGTCWNSWPISGSGISTGAGLSTQVVATCNVGSLVPREALGASSLSL
jgi:transposase